MVVKRIRRIFSLKKWGGQGEVGKYHQEEAALVEKLYVAPLYIIDVADRILHLSHPIYSDPVLQDLLVESLR